MELLFCNNNTEALADQVTHSIFCMDSISATFCKQIDNRVNGTKPIHETAWEGLQQGWETHSFLQLHFILPRPLYPFQQKPLPGERPFSILMDTNFSGM